MSDTFPQENHNEETEEEEHEQTPETSVSDALEKCRREKEQYLAGWKRAKADLENYKRRESERNARREREAENRVLMALLPIIDNFERAAAVLPEETEADDYVKGVLRIRKECEQLLQQFGVERVDATGATFDPTVHEAVSQTESDDHESGKVVAQIHAGYKRGDTLLRPAQVQVAS